jgi:hypothetical protein
VEDSVGESQDTILVISSEGIPDASDVPVAPGILKIGDELVVFQEAELSGDGMQFTGCKRGVLRSKPRAHAKGTRVEAFFGIYVGMLTESVQNSSNQIVGAGLDRFPLMGCVRLEDANGDQAEIRLYTENAGGGVLRMPVNDAGGGLFVARYGTTARSFDAGTPVFWHPVRNWDRFAEYSDDPELSFFALSTELTDAFLKRIYWKEVITAPNLNIRVYARLNEALDWNANAQRMLFLSRDGDSSGGTSGLRVDPKQSPLKYLRAMEDPNGDNLLNIQADRIELRVFVLYENGAYIWNDPTKIGWKSTPILQSLGLEYVNQNRVRRHIDE